MLGWYHIGVSLMQTNEIFTGHLACEIWLLSLADRQWLSKQQIISQIELLSTLRFEHDMHHTYMNVYTLDRYDKLHVNLIPFAYSFVCHFSIMGKNQYFLVKIHIFYQDPIDKSEMQTKALAISTPVMIQKKSPV